MNIHDISWCLWKENLSSNDELFIPCYVLTDHGPFTLNGNLFEEKIVFNINMKSDAIWLKPNPIKKHQPFENVFYPIKKFSPPRERAILLEIYKHGCPVPVTGPSTFNIHNRSDLIRFSFDEIVELKFSNEKTVAAEILEKSFTLSCNS